MHVHFEERVQSCQDQEISDYVWKVASLYVPAGMVSDTYQRRGQYGGGDRLRGPPGEQRGTEGDTGCGDHFRNPREALDRSTIDHKELREHRVRPESELYSLIQGLNHEIIRQMLCCYDHLGPVYVDT